MSVIIRVKQDNVPHCPVCDYSLDMHSATDDSQVLPMNGDASICFNCTTLLVFEMVNNEITLRLPTEEEKVKFDEDPDISRIMVLMKQVKLQQHGLN